MHVVLAELFRHRLIKVPGVKKHGPVRRSAVIYSPGQDADAVCFVDAGYVKLVRRHQGKEVLIRIIPPGGIFGEEALIGGGRREEYAEIMRDGVLYELPSAVLREYFAANPQQWEALTELFLSQVRELEQKIGMLSLYDVEARILHQLASLAGVFGIVPEPGAEYSVPLSQSELANLIGATRETTSTTLNALARRGVLKLGRRVVIVTSPEVLRAAQNGPAGATLAQAATPFTV